MQKTLLAIIACLIFLVSFGIASADVQFSIVPPHWVAQHCEDAGLRVLDVRQERDYNAGHVPNAVRFDANSLRVSSDGGQEQFRPVSEMADLLSKAGVRPLNEVVIYSDGDGVVQAAMVAYVLEKLNIAHAKLLDGGWADYKAAKLPISKAVPQIQMVQLTSSERKGIAVAFNDVQKLMLNPKIIFVDARPNPEYVGSAGSWARSGHIPDAVNFDWRHLAWPDNTHRFKLTTYMQEVLDRKGVRKDDDIVLYCGNGRRAFLEYEILKHVLGYPKVRVYEGAWADYCTYPDMPIETGNSVKPGE